MTVRVIGSGSAVTTNPPSAVTATYSMTNNDATLSVGANSTITLLTPSACAGRILHVFNTGAFSLTSASSNVVPVGSTTAGTAILAATAGKWAELQSTGTNWQIIANN